MSKNDQKKSISPWPSGKQISFVNSEIKWKNRKYFVFVSIFSGFFYKICWDRDALITDSLQLKTSQEIF